MGLLKWWSLRTQISPILTLKITLKNFVTLKRHGNHTEKYLQRKPQRWSRIITLKYFSLLFKDTKITLKILNHTEKFSALLISFVPRFFSITLDLQCDFQCHDFKVIGALWFTMPQQRAVHIDIRGRSKLGVFGFCQPHKKNTRKRKVLTICAHRAAFYVGLSSCSDRSRCRWYTHLTNHGYFDYVKNPKTPNLSPMPV